MGRLDFLRVRERRSSEKSNLVLITTQLGGMKKILFTNLKLLTVASALVGSN